MEEVPSRIWHAGTIFRFVFVAILRVMLVGALYAVTGLLFGPLTLIVTGLASFASVIGFGLLSAAASAVAGALVAVGSLIIRPFSVLVALSLGASLAPAIYFFHPASNSLTLQFLISGPLVGLLGAIFARSAGLLAPDRRLGQGSWQDRP